MPWPISHPEWSTAPVIPSPAPPEPLVPVGLPLQAMAPSAGSPDATVRFRWLAGAVTAPAPLIPRTGGIPPMFAPSFLALSGFEVGRRLRRGVWGIATAMGGYGRADQTSRLRGVRPRPGAEFALGSGLLTAGIAVQGPRGILTPYLRASGGVRGTLIDLVRDVWEIAPALDVGGGLEVGRRRVAWVVDVRWIRSSFNAARLPVVRMPAAPIAPISETLVSTGILLRFGQRPSP